MGLVLIRTILCLLSDRKTFEVLRSLVAEVQLKGNLALSSKSESSVSDSM